MSEYFPVTLRALTQSDELTTVSLANGVSVILEDDGTITINLPARPDGTPPTIETTCLPASNRTHPHGTRYTIHR